MKDDFYSRTFGKDSGNYDYEDKTERRSHYDDFHLENERIAKAAVSRFGVALSVFSAVAYAVIFLAYIILGIFFRDSYEDIIGNVYFTWIMNFIPMYLIAFPILVLIVKGMPKRSRRKSKIGLDEFVLFFFVSQGIMMIGNLVGVALNGLFSALLGKEIDNSVSELIQGSPMWIIVLVVVIAGPIVEELIFRKLMIDRLGKFGDKLAILVSAIAFGLFHGNFYQFFYAAGLGLVLGYLYTKTGNVLYPILMHMIINFFGSVVAIPVANFAVELEELAIAFAEGGQIDLYRLVLAYIVIASYSLLEYGMAIAGIVILARMLMTHSIYVYDGAEIMIPQKRKSAVCLLNVGAIIFLVVSLLQFLANIFLS